MCPLICSKNKTLLLVEQPCLGAKKKGQNSLPFLKNLY
ncbi:hypothetical protein HMPREF1492_1370 [Atopobium sp. BS2]|nr:hypothetical protein HMPREF1492_1370 [Atopobium sp. BS2]